MGKVTICGGVVSRANQRMYAHSPTLAQTSRSSRYSRCAGANRPNAEINKPAQTTPRVIELRGLKPGYRPPVSTPTPAVVPHRQTWTIEIRAYPVSVIKTDKSGAPVINPKTGEVERMFVGIRRVLDAETSGGPDCFANHWRIIVTDRKAKDGGAKVQSLTLASWDGKTYVMNDKTGEQAPHYVKDRALSHTEAICWLDGRTNGQGKTTLGALLSAHPMRKDG
jgi:hypothetical protein